MKKRKLFISVAAIIVVSALLLSLVASIFPASSASLSQQLAEAQNQKKAAERQLSDIQTQKKTTEGDISALDSEIDDLKNKIDSVQGEIDSTTALLAAKTEELNAAEEACDSQFDSFKTRARIMYENGAATYVELLFSAGSFSEFFSGLEIIASILEYDTKVLNERKAVREQIAVRKAEIEGILSDQQTRKQTLAEMQSALNVKKQSQSTLLSQLSEREEKLKKQVEEQIAEENRIQALINSAVASQSNSSAAGTGAMQWPCPSTRRLTSYFSTRQHPIDGVTKMHNGIDIAGGMGVDIVAADSGTVLFAGNSSSYGKYIVISHGNGITTLYAHCSQLLVSAGASVTKGQTIAKVGSTGKSTGPHLHFEVSVNGTRCNPLDYVN